MLRNFFIVSADVVDFTVDIGKSLCQLQTEYRCHSLTTSHIRLSTRPHPLQKKPDYRTQVDNWLKSHPRWAILDGFCRKFRVALFSDVKIDFTKLLSVVSYWDTVYNQSKTKVFSSYMYAEV